MSDSERFAVRVGLWWLGGMGEGESGGEGSIFENRGQAHVFDDEGQAHDVAQRVGGYVQAIRTVTTITPRPAPVHP